VLRATIDRVQNANWWEATANPTAVTSLYSEVPQLRDVRVMSVLMQEDGPTVLLRCCLPAFPDKPPLKWQRHAYNAAFLELRLLGASGLRLEGWSHENLGTVMLTRNGSSVRLEISGQRIPFTADALAADVTHIEGYHCANDNHAH
jgi:hypothetical protein